MLTELPEMTVLLIVAVVTLPVTWTPPATAVNSTLSGREAARLAWLFVTVLLLIVSVPPSRNMPPESAKRPFGAVALAWLPLTVEFLTVSPASSFAIPPPSASLTTAPSPVAEPMRLSLTVVFASVSVPQLSIPPPAACANGQETPPGQGGPSGRAWVGSARLPVMTLLEIVTVAPPVKSAFGGISTPPPRAITPSSPVNGTDSGLDRATPPVMVTPEIETVGSAEAP